MAVYRFRVSFEEFDEVHRHIEIKSIQTFEQFHYAIQEAIGFDASKPASFFMSNDNWKKGQEITSLPNAKNAEGNQARLMKDCRMCDYIADPHQKIYYMFDAPSQWTFFIELTKIMVDEAGKKYPVCVKSIGEAPKQYLVIEPPKGVVDPEFMDDELFSEVGIDEEDEEVESTDETEVGFGEAVDEEEYDNIEETSEEEGEREE